MKIEYMEVRSRFKNLSQVRVDFDEDNLMTVIVGRNGSGKSNVLEALVSIFRNLDLGEAPPFSYLLRYRLGEGGNSRWINVDADPARGTLAKQYEIAVETELKEGKFQLKQSVPLSKVKRSKEGTVRQQNLWVPFSSGSLPSV